MSKLSVIKKLRERTGVGLLELVRIYDECNGSLGQALELIRSRGVEIAKSRSNREALYSKLFTYNHLGRIAVIVEISCESDFALMTAEIKELGNETCFQVVGSEAETVEQLLQQPYVRNPEIQFEEVVNLAQMKISERVIICRFVKMDVDDLVILGD